MILNRWRLKMENKDIIIIRDIARTDDEMHADDYMGKGWQGAVVIPKMWNGVDIFQNISLEERARYIENGEYMVMKNATTLGWSQDQFDRWRIEKPTAITTFESLLYAGIQQPATVPGEQKVRDIVGYNLCTNGAVGMTRLPVVRKDLGYDLDAMIPFRMVPLTADDPASFLQLYMHRREITFNGVNYAQYFTKRCSPTGRNVTVKGEVLPNYPEKNYLGDDDVRSLVEFPITFATGELVEYFRIVKGDAGATGFSSISIMAGRPAKVTHSGTQYDLCTDTVAYSRANFINIPMGVGKPKNLRYQIMYI